MKLINVALVTVLLFNGYANAASVKFGAAKQPSKSATTSANSSATIAAASHSNVLNQCPEHAPDEIVVKMKAGSVGGSGRSRSSRKAKAISPLTSGNSKTDDQAQLEKIIGKGGIEQVDNIFVDDSSSSPAAQKKAKVLKNNNVKFLLKKKGLDRVYRVKVSSNRKTSKRPKSAKKAKTTAHTFKANDCQELNKLIEKLNNDPAVEYAELNMLVKPSALVNDPLFLSHGENWSFPYDELWGIKKIQADKAWDISTGNGAIVAVIDSGVNYNHPDLWDNIWVSPDPDLYGDRNHDGVTNFQDVDLNHDGKASLDDLDLDANKIISQDEIIFGAIGYDFENSDLDPMDETGHGTKVAGIIAAANNNIGVVGVAPKAKIMILKAVSSEFAYVTDVVDAILFATHMGAHISNNSWTGSSSSFLTETFELANAAGMLNIVAAGNNHSDAQYYSLGDDTALTVAALDETDKRLSSSNYGDVVELAAPGGGSTEESIDNIVSTMSYTFPPDSNLQVGSLEPGREGYHIRDGYFRFSGTSAATPYVAGVAALVKGKNFNLTNTEIRSILLHTVDSVNTDKYVGRGRVNAFKAVSADRVPGLPVAQIETISSPVEGIFDLRGTAYAEKFAYYTIEYKNYSLQDPIIYDSREHDGRPVTNGVIARLDSRELFLGRANLELKVYDTDGFVTKKSISFDVVDNSGDTVASLVYSRKASEIDYFDSMIPIIIKIRKSNNNAAVLKKVKLKLEGSIRDLTRYKAKSNAAIPGLPLIKFENNGLTLDDNSSIGREELVRITIDLDKANIGDSFKVKITGLDIVERISNQMLSVNYDDALISNNNSIDSLKFTVVKKALVDKAYDQATSMGRDKINPYLNAMLGSILVGSLDSKSSEYSYNKNLDFDANYVINNGDIQVLEQLYAKYPEDRVLPAETIESINFSENLDSIDIQFSQPSSGNSYCMVYLDKDGWYFGGRLYEPGFGADLKVEQIKQAIFDIFAEGGQYKFTFAVCSDTNPIPVYGFGLENPITPFSCNSIQTIKKDYTVNYKTEITASNPEVQILSSNGDFKIFKFTVTNKSELPINLTSVQLAYEAVGIDISKVNIQGESFNEIVVDEKSKSLLLNGYHYLGTDETLELPVRISLKTGETQSARSSLKLSLANLIVATKYGVPTKPELIYNSKPLSPTNTSSTTILLGGADVDLSISSFTTKKTTYLKGEEIVLTAIVNNNSAVNSAYGVVLRMPQPDFLVFDPKKQDANQFCEAINGEIVCQLSTLANASAKSRTLKFFVSPNSKVGTRELAIGAATVSATSNIANQLTIDSVLANNTKSTNVNLVQYADLSIAVKANKTSYKYNENIALTFTVFNRADASKSYVSDAYAVMSRMALPANYDYAGDNSYCTVDANRILTCNFYTLKSTDSKFQVVTLKPAATAKAGAKTLSFSATNSSEATVLTQKTIDPVTINDTKSINVTVQ